MYRRISVLIAAVAMLSFAVTGCDTGSTTTTTTSTDAVQTEQAEITEAADAVQTEQAEITEAADEIKESPAETAEASAAAQAEETDAVAVNTAEVTDKRDFIVTLYPEYAPITCENFEKLVKDGFYNGIGFHRVVEGFMAQGGDPNGNGTGGSKDTIKGEFSSNGVENKLSHKRGVISMARAMDPDSASSQFFICYTDDCVFLDGNYAAFGEVTEGMEVIDAFLAVPRDLNSGGEIAVPKTPITIKEAKMIDADEKGNPRVQFTMEEFINP